MNYLDNYKKCELCLAEIELSIIAPRSLKQAPRLWENRIENSNHSETLLLRKLEKNADK